MSTRTTVEKRWFLVCALPTLALLAGCARSPVTGKPTLSLISEEQEIAIGKEAAAQVAGTVGLYDDKQMQQYVSQLGQQIAARSERPNLPWSFAVVDDPAVNAFALPGGFIFVTRGLMAHLDSEAQLAAVLGHEIAHVTARHSVQQISRQQLAQFGLAVGMIFSETLRQFGELGMAGLNLLFLKYGRDAEREADRLGFGYTAKSGYETRTMPAVFTTLDKVSQLDGAGRLPSWLSTHPAGEERVELLEGLIAKTSPPKGKVGRDRYLAVVDNTVFGVDPRQGFFADGAFFHPRLRFQLRLPPGWKGQNTAQAVIAQSPDQGAAFELSLAKEAAPEAALRRFAAQRGVVAAQPVSSPVGGLPSASAQFAAQTEEGRVAGLVTFVRYGDRTYRLLGLATENRLPAYAGAFREAQASFAPLRDPELLAARPARLQVVRVPGDMTLAQFAERDPPSVPVERLAIVNQVNPGTRLEGGQRIKTIEGGTVGEEAQITAD